MENQGVRHQGDVVVVVDSAMTWVKSPEQPDEEGVSFK